MSLRDARAQAASARIAASTPSGVSGNIRPLKDVGDHACRLRIGPLTFGGRVDPDPARPGLDRPLEPDLSGLGIEMFDRAARRDDLVGAHRRVADEDHAVVPAVGIEQVARRQTLVVPAPVVLPHALVEAVVEVEMLEPLELALGGGKELFGRLDVPVHRAADVEKQQHLDRALFRRALAELHVDVALVGGRADRSDRGRVPRPTPSAGNRRSRFQASS